MPAAFIIGWGYLVTLSIYDTYTTYGICGMYQLRDLVLLNDKGQDILRRQLFDSLVPQSFQDQFYRVGRKVFKIKIFFSFFYTQNC